MAESPMVGCRVPAGWAEEIRQIANTTGKSESAIVREAVAQYLGKHDAEAVTKGMEDIKLRLADLERWREKISQLMIG